MKVIVAINTEQGHDCVLGVYRDIDSAVTETLEHLGDIEEGDMPEFIEEGAQVYMEARCYVFSEQYLSVEDSDL